MMDWLYDSLDGWGWFLILVAGTLALILLIGWAENKEQEEWQAFAAAHHCVVIRHEKGGTATTITTNGKVGFTELPDRTTYKCDDGMEYTR